MIEHHELAIADRPGVSRAVGAVEQRDFAKYLACPEDGQNNVGAGRGGGADPYAALQDGHHAATGRAFREDRAACRKTFKPRVQQQRIEIVRRQLAEQRMTSEQPPPFAEAGERQGYAEPIHDALHQAATPDYPDPRNITAPPAARFTAGFILLTKPLRLVVRPWLGAG